MIYTPAPVVQCFVTLPSFDMFGADEWLRLRVAPGRVLMTKTNAIGLATAFDAKSAQFYATRLGGRVVWGVRP